VPLTSRTGVSRVAEERRLDQSRRRVRHWNRWGPYLADRAWGTVREDYSRGPTPWEYFPHDHARSRVYRWNEDGLLGLCDRISASRSRSRCGTDAIPSSKNGSSD
jgi:hypothetical protein